MKVHSVCRMLLLFPVFLFSGAGWCAEDTVPNVWSKPGLDTARRIEMTCGGTRVEIVCGYNENFNQMDDRICSNNTLIFTLENGERIFPEIPKWYLREEFTPISIACIEEYKNPSKLYVYTRYLNGSYNCKMVDHNCNQEVVFTIHGKKIDQNKEKLRLSDYRNSVSIEQRNTDYPYDHYFEDDGEEEETP